MSLVSGNSPTNAVDPTGLIQAGNPLTNLFGGYTGNQVSANKPINPFVASGGGLSSYSTPKSIDQYFANQGLQNLANPSPLSAGSYNFSAISREQFFDARLNPLGKPVKVEKIESQLFGDQVRKATDYLTSTRVIASSPTLSLFTNLVGSGNAATVDTIFATSDPSYLVTHRDGSQTYHMGEGPSTGSLAGQALLYGAPVIGGASRPAGSLVLRSAPKTTTITPNKVRFLDEAPSKYGYAQDYEDAATGARSNVADTTTASARTGSSSSKWIDIPGKI